jgi:hypothetical protein
MPREKRENVTLDTLHTDLQVGFSDLKGEVRGGLADLKATLVTGFRSLPTRESSEEMVRLLREGNRIQEERFTQLDVRIREQYLEIQQVLRAVAEGQRNMIDGQRTLVENQGALTQELRGLAGEIRSLSSDIKALIARLDVLIKGRGDGAPPP